MLRLITTGQVLSVIRRCVNDLHDVRDLALNNLLLAETDATELLNDVINKHRSSLTHLEMLNLSKDPCAFHLISQLTSLSRLTVTLSSFDAEALLDVCTGVPSLEEIVFVDDRFTVRRRCSTKQYAILSSAWFAIRRMNDRLLVRLEFRRREDDILTEDGLKSYEDDVLPYGAPVHSVIYTSTMSRVTSEYISRLAVMYSNTLVTYGHIGLGRGYRSRKFSERSDAALVTLVRSCPNLHTLAIRERISTTTLLIITREANALRRLYVRRNAVILRRDWARDPAWNDEYWNWLWMNARSYEAVEIEIGKCLRYEKRWRMLSDAEFKQIVV